MNRLKNSAVALIGFGFVAIGIFLLTVAETREDVLTAGVSTLFFAAVGLVGLMDVLPASLPRKQKDGRILVAASRWRAGVFAFGGLAFMVAGGAMLARAFTGGLNIGLLLGGLGVPFGLTVLIYAGRQMLAGGVLYVLDDAGIESRTGIKWRLAWPDIASISSGSVGANRWLMFETLPGVPDPPGKLPALNRRFNLPPYAIAPGTSGVNFDALADTIVTMWEARRGPAAPA